jgi:hypothetical protein
VNITRKNGRPKKYADSVGNKDHTAYMRWWRAKTGKKYAYKSDKTTRKRARMPIGAFLDAEPPKYQSASLAALETALAAIDARAKGA